MASSFAGFPKSGIAFLRDLKRNNNRDWFTANKRTYEEDVRQPMIALVEALNVEMAAFAPDYRVEPKKAIPRVNRDTRFSKDKSPYKTQIAAILPCGGREKHEAAGFYVEVSGEGVLVIGGTYMPAPPQLSALRRKIAADHAAFRKLLTAGSLKRLMGSLQGECLQRVPKDFPADHPAGDLLRFKQFYFQADLLASLATEAKLLAEVVKRFKVMTPFVKYLDVAMS
jgi:uncharacterized protein (TIGR02453 family)